MIEEDACDRTKWRGMVKTMTIRNPANSVDGENTGSNDDMMMMYADIYAKRPADKRFLTSSEASQSEKMSNTLLSKI